MIRLYNQDVLVRAAPPPAESATYGRGSAATVSNRLKRLGSSRVSNIMKRLSYRLNSSRVSTLMKRKN
jgi:arginine repressor